MEQSNSDSLLIPGEIIKPIVPDGAVAELVKRLYGLEVISCKELNSYDDKNYHILVTDQSLNPNIKEVHKEGYVVKVLNTLESKRPMVIDAQLAMMEHLRSKNMNVPETVPMIDGKSMSLEKIYTKGKMYAEKVINNDAAVPFGYYIVRMLKFIPGKIVFCCPYTAGLFYNVGRFLGDLQNALKGFQHPFYDSHTFIWSLLELHKLTDFVFAVENKIHRDTVLEILEAFQQEVAPHYDKLQKGVIHGDLNEQNMLAQEVPGQDSVPPEERVYDICGLLDFADVSQSYCVFDVAIAVAYMSIESKTVDQLDVCGHVLAGLLTKFELNSTERDILKILICGRLCQSLVLGAYTFYQDPTNTYVLTTATNGWPFLLRIWGTPKEELQKRWYKIIKSYQA